MAQLIGRNTTIDPPRETISMDKENLITAIRFQKVPAGTFSFPRKGTPHPTYGELLLETWRADKVDAGFFYDLQTTYEGVQEVDVDDPEDPPEGYGPDGLPLPVYELTGSLGEEPISTSPIFQSTIGGTAAAPLNGAIFDDEGLFVGFDSTSKYAGISKYLEVGAMYTETAYSKSSGVSLAGLGKIATPAGSPPSATGRDWLYFAGSYQVRGGIYQNRRAWLLSGSGGWADFYAP